MKLIIPMHVASYTFDIHVINKNGSLIETVSTNKSNLNEQLNYLRLKYTIDSITLCGNKDYLLKFKRDITNINEFSHCEVKIEEI